MSAARASPTTGASADLTCDSDETIRPHRRNIAPRGLALEALHPRLPHQAYAISDDYQIFGIPTRGTTDYRDVALQFRYDANRKNIAVVQLRHAKFGDSPQQRDNVELDWAFYQHNFSDRFAVKAGRIPLPLGIFNETHGELADVICGRIPARQRDDESGRT